MFFYYSRQKKFLFSFKRVITVVRIVKNKMWAPKISVLENSIWFGDFDENLRRMPRSISLPGSPILSF